LQNQIESTILKACAMSFTIGTAKEPHSEHVFQK